MWALVGAVGVGLVWGWLLATLIPSQRATFAVIAAGAATILFFAEMLLFGGIAAAVALAIAATMGMGLHLAFRDAVRSRLAAMEGEA